MARLFAAGDSISWNAGSPLIGGQNGGSGISGNCSAAAWVNPNASIGTSYGYIFEYGLAAANITRGCYLRIYYNSGLYVQGGDYNGVVVYKYQTSITGEWAHVGLSFSNSTMRLYVNGLLVGSGALTPYAPAGNAWYAASGFYGKAAEIGFWPFPLDTSQFADLAAGLPVIGIPGSIVAAPLDGLLSPELDLSGNFNSGVLTGTSYADHPEQVRYPGMWLPAFNTTSSSSFIPAWAMGHSRAYGRGASYR